MANRKMASALTIATLLACAIPTKSVASYLMTPVMGQAAPSFPVPDTVAKGTKISVASSSDNTNAISETLAKGFKSQYSGTVDVTTTDTNAAIQEVLNGNADLAAISRPLSAEEKAKGLIAVPVRREKIAIVAGKDNPFASSLTGDQFARILRGEIKNWSEVGGPSVPIKFIDRPDASETRQSLEPYPVFAGSGFKTGSNATQLSEDSTDALAKAIGKDGIGYALVSQLQGQPGIKAVELHKTLPDDPRYPFSQPYSFVYAGGASPAVAAFLGYATGNPGQSALNGADLSGYAILPTAGATAAAANGAGTGENSAIANGNATGTAEGTTSNSANGSTNGNATGDTATDGTVIIEEDGSAVVDGADRTNGVEAVSADRGRWWWLLLPLAGLGLLIWAASRRGSEEETGYVANGETADDRVRGAYRSDRDLPNTGPNTGPNTELNFAEAGGAPPAIRTGASVESTGLEPTGGLETTGLRAAAGGAAIAGTAGAAGRMSNKGGDTAMNLKGDLEGIPGSVKDGIGVTKDSAQGNINSLRSNMRSSVEGDRTNFQSSPDGLKSRTQEGLGNLRSNVQSGADSTRTNVEGGVKGGIDSTRTNLSGGADDFRGSAQGSSVESSGGSWLDRAKARINEATDQMKDKASDSKDDITEE